MRITRNLNVKRIIETKFIFFISVKYLFIMKLFCNNYSKTKILEKNLNDIDV